LQGLTFVLLIKGIRVVKKKILYLILLTSTAYTHTQKIFFNKTHYSLRPQGSNAARYLMSTQDARTIALAHENGFYGYAQLALEYQQIFNRTHGCTNTLGAWFSPNGKSAFTFGPDKNDPTITLNPGYINATGITQDLKDGVDVRALDFGLSTSHKSTLCITPRIKNVIADVSLWISLDRISCNWWARLDIPFTWTKWFVETNEHIDNMGGTNYGCGSLVQCPYLCTPGPQVNAPAPEVVYTSQKDAWCGKSSFGQVPPLHFGTFNRIPDSTFNASGIRLDIGYDMWRRQYGHIGAGITIVAGTGTQSTAEYFFQPVVGAQRSWQLGGTCNASYAFRQRELTGFLVQADITATHICAHRQERLFGLKNNGPWSHYLLLKKFSPDATATSLRLSGFERTANILSTCVDISNAIMVDAACALTYRHCAFEGTLGANIWFRSQDKLGTHCLTIEPHTYGIKGTTECNAQTASLSTINQSKGVGLNNTLYGAHFTQDLPHGVPTDVNDGFLDVNQTIPNTITLTSNDIDPYPALHPDALSGKIFGSLIHTWHTCDREPFILIGGEIECGKNNAAVDQWGIVVKGGILF
jgi:hypothetical protein